MSGAFNMEFADLPAEIPVFPLPRVILLPRVQLPLNIFEPRYLAMIEAALSTPHRLIGMIQPRADGAEDALYATGCAGRISSFEQTQDGRYLVSLGGVCRFDVAEELQLDKRGFRRIRADWLPYQDDLIEDKVTDICRDTMMTRLRAYLAKMDMFCDKWETIRNVECEKLISTLSVVCPFECEEKQALLEAKTLPDRARILQALLEMAAKESDCGCGTCH